MSYKLKDGKTITDNELEALASEYESGEWSGHLKNVVIGVPKPDDDLTVISFRLPKSRVRAVENAIKKKGISKSEFYRQAVDRELIALS